MLEYLFGWNASRIRGFFESHGLRLQEWDNVQTDSITVCRTPVAPGAPAVN